MSATAAVRAVLLAVVALLLVPVGARAADLPPAGTVVTLTGPTQQAMRTTATLVAAVTDADGTPEPGVTVRLESLTGGSWQPVTSAVTDDAGQASLPAPLSAVSTSNLFRAVVDTGAGVVTSATWSVTGVPRSAPLRISLNTHRVVDGRSITLSLRWITGDGLGVPGTVQVTARAERRTTVVAVLHLGSDGRASVRLTPRYDTSYRATGAAGAWWTSATAGPSTVDNLPSGRVITLPEGAPRPRITLPAQPRALKAGAHPVITRIPTRVWRGMVGRSWHAGCPVGRAGLRLLRINYMGFDGYAHRGELVASAGAVTKIAGALGEMYRRDLPIRAMYRVDRFGWSGRLAGANDLRSMAADNTSAFNCRHVTNDPRHLSPHAYGRALDVNTWENPYRSRTGLVPDAWWQHHRLRYVTARSRSDIVVRVMVRHGLRWTYGLGDTQHFDGRRTTRPPVLLNAD